jgi:hypothetical protein
MKAKSSSVIPRPGGPLTAAQSPEIAHQGPDLLARQRLPKRGHTVAPVHHIAPGVDRVEQRVIRSAGHVGRVRVRGRSNWKKGRVITIPPSPDPVTRRAGPGIEVFSDPGLGGARWTAGRGRSARRGDGGRFPLNQITGDQLESGLAHGHARHDSTQGVSNHRVHAIRGAPSLQAGQAGPDPTPFSPELVAPEARQPVTDQPLGLGDVECG